MFFCFSILVEKSHFTRQACVQPLLTLKKHETKVKCVTYTVFENPNLSHDSLISHHFIAFNLLYHFVAMAWREYGLLVVKGVL